MQRRFAWLSQGRRRARRGLIYRLLALFVAFELVGSSALPASEVRWRTLTLITAGWWFDLGSWEIGALSAKARALLSRPASGLSQAAASQQVRDYMARADKLYELEDKIDKLFDENQNQPTAASNQLQGQVEALRQQQLAARPAVEAIIQGQVGQKLLEAGATLADYTFPPVNFAFVEPPRLLVASPRDRIERRYNWLLQPQMSLQAIEESERRFRAEHDLSAYATRIGGLGAFPTMVVDRASLDWILGTVAHEWAHNYLTLFPLGQRFANSADLITLNETAAEVVGNEVGKATLASYYPDLVPPPPPRVTYHPLPLKEPKFDFDSEMRETRLEVDRLLGEGKVVQAEQYMELRRQLFVKNDYALRVLNQAYFAFHGSYGTGAASSSPIGPKMEKLRKLTPNLLTYLQVIRGFTQPADLDAALVTWQAKVGQ